MNDPIQRAARDAVEAADNTELVRTIAAVLAAQQLAQAQQQPAPQACQHKTGRGAGEWLAIGGAVCVGSIGLAFASIALAIAACCATACLLILRAMWRDFTKGK